MLHLTKHEPRENKFPSRSSYYVKLICLLALTYYVQFYGTGLALNTQANQMTPIFILDKWESCGLPLFR